ncbi:MAG TPA: hypothetical protein VNS32_04160 [Flavisolibacter sp.]|nr:hypothetical protein [Flavisolibacter sp.]HWJ90368.1 hypothetical protein [Flavisolibacter sp.]
MPKVIEYVDRYRQQLFNWQKNIGNTAMNRYSLRSLAFGGKASCNWKNLTPVYRRHCR